MKRLLNKFSSAKGFTLIELLIVITIISALAIAVFVALNPAQRVKDANDARRAADADTILTAIHTSIVDNDGTLPTGLTAGMAETQISQGVVSTGCGLVTTGGCSVLVGTVACVDLGTALPAYLKKVPADPLIPNPVAPYKTNYSVQVDPNSIVTIKACGTQGTTNISVSR